MYQSLYERHNWCTVIHQNFNTGGSRNFSLSRSAFKNYYLILVAY